LTVIFFSVIAALVKSAVRFKVQADCRPSILLRVVSMSNHDRSGLLLGRNLVKHPG
jgi:hypothetical protein